MNRLYRENNISKNNHNNSPTTINNTIPAKQIFQTANTNDYMNGDNKVNLNGNSSLWTSPKDIRNGKNFYENYSKENDKRKKEGWCVLY